MEIHKQKKERNDYSIIIKIIILILVLDGNYFKLIQSSSKQLGIWYKKFTSLMSAYNYYK